MKKAAEEIEKVVGEQGLDVLVNNAGFVEGQTAGLVPSVLSEEGNVEMVVKSFNMSFETNVLGAIYGMFPFFPPFLSKVKAN